MAKVNYSQLEQDIGLASASREIIVGANIWDSKGNFYKVNIITTRAKMHNAFKNEKGRFSTEKCLQLIKDDKTDGLKALAYRAKVSDAKKLSVREKNACHLGIENLTMKRALDISLGCIVDS